MSYNSKAFLDLLNKLSSDPKVKAAIDSAKSEAFKSSDYQATSILDLISYLMKYSGSFIGKKKAEKLTEYTGYLVFIITVSMILKKNLFDRPEVKEFFVKNWEGAKRNSSKFYNICQNYAAEAVDRIKKKRSKRV